MSSFKGIKIFSGSAHLDLSRKIAQYLHLTLGRADVTVFSDGESRVQIQENVRGYDVFVVQPTCPPVNQNLMELLIMLDALKRSSVYRLTAVIPYYGYARQDRKDCPRVPISAKLVADLLEVAGIDRILSIDLHADQIQGFFDKPVDHLSSAPVFSRFVLEKGMDDFIVCSVDVGGIKRARMLANTLGKDLAVVDKRRESSTLTEVMNVLGEVKGRNVLLVDDMIATGGSLVKAAEALKKRGAKTVYAFATHGIFAGQAQQLIEDSPLKKVFVTNTIPEKEEGSDKVERIPIDPLLGEAIRRIHLGDSVNSLFQ